MLDQKIYKYLRGTATSKEEKEVQNWITASDINARRFNLLKAKHIASALEETNMDLDGSYHHIVFAQKPSSSDRRRFSSTILKSVAIFAILLVLSSIFRDTFVDSGAKSVIPEDAIILQLENGNIEVISEEGTAKVVDSEGNVLGAQQGSRLIYKKSGAPKEGLVYNTLTVPYGKRFDVLLSDGTQVTLNSGTSLKYPVQFLNTENRQVFLDGEAFFNVAKDTVHPFIVNTNQLNVRVLGTKFNLSSYPEDQFVNTTLLEGSVSVYNKQDSFDSSKASLLEPGFKAEWNKYNKQILIEEADIAMHTDWLNGKIILRHVPFKNIVKKLERHYNVEIVNNNPKLDQELFTASFDIETIDQVFQTFNLTYEMDYKINDRQIIIN
ncbi:MULTISPECIES: FecR family protein [unclassified Arenibacter]|jgi:ferric-dicitrate binding protein FerR (iron transport regulator)|uniref:FecR family protein n=1 Tax=unclassified Arenibacter TaxID=2615047 RepID=UPI000E340BA3|nr:MULTISPECIES: FecR domain-containing protein [unclassified Arenibacter]MCM4162501.1 iron dicitrate transport regulator FecR [Arenibacter sp. A80]RFT58085.1 FecR family protein [Arenibacter sp. P308M17]